MRLKKSTTIVIAQNIAALADYTSYNQYGCRIRTPWNLVKQSSETAATH
jgi:hypothetical protein